MRDQSIGMLDNRRLVLDSRAVLRRHHNPAGSGDLQGAR